MNAHSFKVNLKCGYALWSRKSTAVFLWTRVLFHMTPSVGKRKAEAVDVVLVFGFFSDYHLPFEGNNVGLSSGSIALAVRTGHRSQLELCCKLHHAETPLLGDCPHVTLHYLALGDCTRT